MGKGSLTAFLVFFLMLQVNAQIGAMKLVGNNTKDYSMGFGAFIKTGGLSQTRPTSRWN
jgi:hypothetical protein